MPRKKKEVGFAEGVENTTSSSNPEIKVVFDLGITPLDPGVRHDTDVLVGKINELIKKVNK